MSTPAFRNMIYRYLIAFFCLCVLAPGLRAEEWTYESVYTHYSIVKEGSVVELRHLRKETSWLESAIDLSDPPRQVVAYSTRIFSGVFFTGVPQKALMIGLGGGGINRLFNTAFTTSTLQTVDVDAMALELSKKHMGFTESDRNRVEIMDGRRYVKKSNEKWNWVILDAFHGGYIPFHLKTKEFYEEIKKILAPGGLLLSNLHSETMLYDSDVKTLQACFPQVMLFEVPDTGNVIAVAATYASPKLTDQLDKYSVSAANPVLKKYLDLDAIKKSVILKPDQKQTQGNVLTDDYCPVEYLNSMER